MKLVYKGNRNKYSGIINNEEIEWLRSEKKSKYYFKLYKIVGEIKFMIIGFKGGYLMVYEEGKIKGHIVPARNYYHIMREGVPYEITPKFIIPF